MQRFVGKPLTIASVRLLAAINLHPGNFATAPVSLLNGSIHDAQHRRRDIDADAVTLYVGNDGFVGHAQRKIGIDLDLVAVRRNDDMLVLHAYTLNSMPCASGSSRLQLIVLV